MKFLRSCWCVISWSLIVSGTLAAPIELLNPGGEINNGVDRVRIANPAVVGWNSNGGQVINDRTDYGNGGWRLSIEDSQAMWQMSAHTIQPGDAFGLRFDAAIFVGTTPDPLFVSDLTLIGPDRRNGDFNADAAAIDSRRFSDTPDWVNIGSAGNLSEATRSGPVNTLFDGTRNAVVSAVGGRQFAIDCGHVLTTGEEFQVRYHWRDAGNWDDASDLIRVTLFYTDTHVVTGPRRDIQTLNSGPSSVDASYQEEVSLFDPIPPEADGKRLFLFFEGVDGNGDNLGFARLDELVLERGSSNGAATARYITAELYVDAGMDRQVIASRDYTFKSTVVGSWHHYHLAVPAGAVDAHAGRTLGVQFRSSDNGLSNFQSVDHIRLDHWPASAPVGDFSDDWDSTSDQVWIGPGYWANRLHDWEVRNHRVNCLQGARDRRTAHRVGTSLRGNGGDFSLAVTTGLHLGTNNANARAGFLLGAGPNLDWRGSLLVHDGLGRDFGLFLGLRNTGEVTIEDYNTGSLAGSALAVGNLPAGGFRTAQRLELDALYVPARGIYTLNLRSLELGSTNVLSQTSTSVPSDRVLGSLGLLSHKGGNNARFWFDDFSGTGAALESEPDRDLTFLGAMYTLSRGTLKLTAQLSPVDLGTTPPIRLETWDGTSWNLAATQSIDNTDNLSSYTATFRIPGWDDTVDTDYRLVARMAGTDYYWRGTVRRDPVDKNEIVIAATTCQRISDGNVQSDGFDWSPARLWHPHTLAFAHMPKHQPDLFIANGDQIYEGQPTPEDSGTDFNRQHDYLYKWYLWMLQARDMTRGMPTIAMPDDHDVFQGNLWGEGGIATANQSTGGYEEPASWVKLVDRTQTSHLPDADPYNPSQPAPPIAQGIEVYFTGMIYGELGIAIIEDRKFKTGSLNPPADLDQQFLIGDRQKDFLRTWNTDWSGQQLKFVLSQSPFANLHTHANTGYNFGLNDKDAHGWPVHRRNEVWEILRRSRMFQLAGDQHVATVARHGITGPADAGYSFTLPAIANFFPRVWDPVHNAGGTTATISPYKGDFFFNGGGTLPTGEPNLNAQDPAHVRLLAAGNPHEYYRLSRNVHPANLHDRGAGYGVVRIDKTTREITFECWPLHADPAYPSTGTQFADWPITIRQTDNEGRTPSGFLPVIDTQWRKNPVVYVYRESTGRLEYALRIRGNLFRPPVYDNAATYRVELSYGDADPTEVYSGQSPAAPDNPTIHSFAAIEPSIVEGDTATLRWNVENPTTLNIDQGVGDVRTYTVDGIGFVSVSPASDTVYTLTLNGVQVAATTVRVFAHRASWDNTHFTPSERLDPLVSGGDADPDNDGFSNDQEFQFQTTPRDGGIFPQIVGEIVQTNDRLNIAFTSPYPLQAESCCLIVERSDDLENWMELPSNAYTETARDNLPAQGTSVLTIRLRSPAAVTRGLYYRARWLLAKNS